MEIPLSLSCGGQQDRVADAIVRATAAEITLHRLGDLVVGRIGLALQEDRRCHDQT
jgi:hypothetical protein